MRWPSLSGPVVSPSPLRSIYPSFRALSERLKFNFNEDSLPEQVRGMDALAQEQQREISGLREEVSSRPTGSRHFYRKRVVTSLYFLL